MLDEPAVESYAANLSTAYPVSAFFDPARLGVSIEDAERCFVAVLPSALPSPRDS